MDEDTREYGKYFHHTQYNNVQGGKHQKEDSCEIEGKAYDGYGKVCCTGLAAIIVGERAFVDGLQVLVIFFASSKSVVKESLITINEAFSRSSSKEDLEYFIAERMHENQ